MNRILLAFLFLFGPAKVAFCQLRQQHPELCGGMDRVGSLPRDFAVAIEPETLGVRFYFGSPGPMIEVFDPLDEILQACSLSDGRIVLFGKARDSSIADASSIYILDGRDRVLLDHFYGFGPAMSPDQRWIVFRKMYAMAFEDGPSDEYLLYDLSRNPLQNRATGVAADEPLNVGAPVFPAGLRNVLRDNVGLPPEQQHSAGSGIFWSPDSTALAFADIVMGRTSIVLVTIGESGSTETSILPLQEAAAQRERCAGGSHPIAEIEFGAKEGSNSILFVRFSEGCAAKSPLQVHLSDFRPVKPESRPTRPVGLQPKLR